MQWSSSISPCNRCGDPILPVINLVIQFRLPSMQWFSFNFARHRVGNPILPVCHQCSKQIPIFPVRDSVLQFRFCLPSIQQINSDLSYQRFSTQVSILPVINAATKCLLPAIDAAIQVCLLSIQRSNSPYLPSTQRFNSACYRCSDPILFSCHRCSDLIPPVVNAGIQFLLPAIDTAI